MQAEAFSEGKAVALDQKEKLFALCTEGGFDMAKKVLIIDDEPDFVDAVSSILEAEGYDVISAPDGSEGFKKAKAESPDIILLDVMMTRKTEGFEVAQNFKNDEATKNIPVIMLTGIRKAMDIRFSLGPDDEWLPVKALLEKPVKPETLLSVIEENLKE